MPTFGVQFQLYFCINFISKPVFCTAVHWLLAMCTEEYKAYRLYNFSQCLAVDLSTSRYCSQLGKENILVGTTDWWFELNSENFHHLLLFFSSASDSIELSYKDILATIGTLFSRCENWKYAL